MPIVGSVQQLWRYPVKGMGGEPLARSPVDSRGIDGDRQWAVRETARREIQSCKRHPALLMCTARFALDAEHATSAHVRVHFPDGDEFRADSPEIHARLSALTGTGVTLEPLRSASDAEFYRRYNAGGNQWLVDLAATFAREPGEPLPDFRQLPPAMIEFVTEPGSFALVAPLHIITTASLRRLTAWNGTSDWDVRRFRPNIVIETKPELDGLIEQTWIGKRLRIGALMLDCVGATPRCGAITRPQNGLPGDAGMLRTVVRQADQNVGVYCTIATAGNIGLDDTVLLDD